MSTSSDLSLVIAIPAWIDELVAAFPGPLETDEHRMALAVDLSRHNVERGGGPFAALVFAGARLVAAGVNRVVDTGLTIAHAEILALMRAQRRLGLRLAPDARPCALITTAEPCCQCFGAIFWSGIDRLRCGATTEDAEAIGFEEGPKPLDWAGVLERRGISVRREVGRAEARAVLDEYARRGGEIYGRRPSPVE
jgi:tRNA(Arg) A34 adenosine deaminase TadA